MGEGEKDPGGRGTGKERLYLGIYVSKCGGKTWNSERGTWNLRRGSAERIGVSGLGIYSFRTKRGNEEGKELVSV